VLSVHIYIIGVSRSNDLVYVSYKNVKS